jgi:mRNA-degrading endonuclease RelE of RelBE toxin-antitoxin system
MQEDLSFNQQEMERAQRVGDHVYLTIQKDNNNLPFPFFMTMFLAIHRSSYYRLHSHHSRVSYEFNDNAQILYIYLTNDNPYIVQSDHILVSTDKGDGWSIDARSQGLLHNLDDTIYPPNCNIPTLVHMEEVWEFVGEHGRYECIKRVTGASKTDAITKTPIFELRILFKNSDMHTSDNIDQLIHMAMDIIGE